MKKLSKKIITKLNKELMSLNFDKFEDEYCIGWHKGTGLTVDEWMLYLFQYGRERKRNLFFALTEWGNPAVYFDATNEEEWRKVQKLATDEQIKFWDSEGWSMKKVKGKENRFKKKH